MARGKKAAKARAQVRNDYGQFSPGFKTVVGKHGGSPAMDREGIRRAARGGLVQPREEAVVQRRHGAIIEQVSTHGGGDPYGEGEQSSAQQPKITEIPIDHALCFSVSVCTHHLNVAV